MGAPQIIFLAMAGLSVGIGIAKHGQPMEDYNGWTILLSAIVEIGLLWWGGFFK